MRWSRAFIPTEKETPADAEIISHQLMLRSGMVRKLAAGVFSFLPLGLRTVHKVAAIVREEMSKIDAQEILMPVLQPADLWKTSGRWDAYGRELMRIQDRHNRSFALGPTHEEVVTLLASHFLKSYKQLPQTLYQIQVKFRDEIRPRFGVMRAREFVMKDAYSFHSSEASLDETYQDMRRAYCRILERCGLTYRVVEADTGVIGGAESHEFMVLAKNGESEILSCNQCDYSANVERAETITFMPEDERAATGDSPEEISTPGKKSVQEVAEFLSVDSQDIVKTLLWKVEDQTIAVLLPGSRDLNEAKLAVLTGSSLMRMLRDDEVEPLTGAAVGYAGPVGLPENVKIYVDKSLQHMKSMIVGANKTDTHLRHVAPGKDFQVAGWGDLVLAKQGDRCARCEGTFESTRGIEVGHIFKLGTKYSETMGAGYLDEGGKEHPQFMGCYGFGVTRTVAATIEQHYDDNGICWPASLAPFAVLITPVNAAHEESMELAQSLYDHLRECGVDTLLDDRTLRAGAKFKDADLIGIPLRVTIGERGLKENLIEVRQRQSGEVKKVPKEQLAASVVEWATTK